MSKLDEQEMFKDSVWVQSAELTEKLLFEVFTALCVLLVLGEAADCDVEDWFRRLKWHATGLVALFFQHHEDVHGSGLQVLHVPPM